MKYKAHDYQAYATNFILEHPISAVFLDIGALLPVGRCYLNHVILRVSGQLHRPGSGDGIILTKWCGVNIHSGGHGF